MASGIGKRSSVLHLSNACTMGLPLVYATSWHEPLGYTVLVSTLLWRPRCVTIRASIRRTTETFMSL